MSERLQVSPKTVIDQRRASDPRQSAWVSANAGAGKTKVLADRVMRLMLAGVKPGRILCLTFTKAAAANMSVRVFDQLGRWVTADDETLRAIVTELEGEAPDAAKMRRARRLFARAVETPGGLKIETIHAFCERILHIAPFEANVPASFEVLDETVAARILSDATSEVLTLAASGDDPPLAAALRRLAIEASDDGIRKAIACALGERATMRRAVRDPAGLALAFEQVAAAEGIAPMEDEAAIEADMLAGGLDEPARRAIADELLRGSKTDAEYGGLLKLSLSPAPPESRLEHYLAVFFTAKGEMRKRLGTKAIAPDTLAALEAEQLRLAGLAQKKRTAAALARTRALIEIAAAIYARVEDWKRAGGCLDFDDLIERTVALLQRDSAAWVLYKLDAGIDHLLVDEAQDTSPAQWQILETLTAEFRAGLGRREPGQRPPTIFAVGDPKQSIYGFQGAAPRLFEETGEALNRAVMAAQGRFAMVQLTQSFRSVPAILSAVDQVFSDPAHFNGLSFAHGIDRTVHVSARPSMPGAVEIWPVIEPAERSDPDAWSLPLDEPETGAPPVRNALRIAAACRRWISDGDGQGRRVHPGEILILARKRGPAFEATIRALKAAGVPVAGADRIDLTGHIAVMDLMALGRATLLPADDLTLAGVLKSPLVGWTDDDLLRIAAPRPEGMALQEALAAAARASDAAAIAAAQALRHWRELAARHGPFAFYATILGPRGGREALIARLGLEAGDAIDTFLAQAFAHERANPPSLLGFLAAMEATSQSVKREMEGQGGQVRVMTVHGAKGLEAPIVLLIDGGEKPDASHDPPLFAVAAPDGTAVPLWSPRKDLDPPPVAAARAALREEDAREHNRLLYVAMTRAKDRLIIAPFRGKREQPAESWSAMARRSLDVDDPRRSLAASEGLGEVVAWREAGEAAAPQPEPEAIPPPRRAVPDWLFMEAPREPEPAPPLRPSGALGAADRAPRPADAPFVAQARLVGTVVHALLERLPDMPSAERAATAAAFVAVRLPRLDRAAQDAVVANALRVIDHPALGPLFGAAARAEVPVAGLLTVGGESVPVSGQVDRLAITEDAVHVVDFKTSARAPRGAAGLPASHMAQLSIYAALLQQMAPGKPVRCFLVYTATGSVFEVSDEMRAVCLATLRKGEENGGRPILDDGGGQAYFGGQPGNAME